MDVTLFYYDYTVVSNKDKSYKRHVHKCFPFNPTLLCFFYNNL